MKELFASILAHTVPHLPKLILRWIYSPERLARDVRFASPQSIIVNYGLGELQMSLPVTNSLPMDVFLVHLQIDVMVERSTRLVHIEYSRRTTLPHGATNIEIPITNLNSRQLELIGGRAVTLWIFGEADLSTSFERTFIVHVTELSSTAKILNFAA
jgi:hypothetical protein